MAVAATLLNNGSDNADASAYTTTSVAITKPTLFAMSVSGITAHADASISVPSGVTAAYLGRITQPANDLQMDVWWLTGTGTGTFTVTHAIGCTGAIWWFDEFDDAATDTPTNVVLQSNVNSNSLDVTLPETPEATSGVWMALTTTSRLTVWTLPAGSTATSTLIDAATPNRSLLAAFDAPAPAGANYNPSSSTSTPGMMVAVEVAEASAPAASSSGGWGILG